MHSRLIRSIEKNRGTSKIIFYDTGKISYSNAYELQLKLFELVRGECVPGVILLLEHLPVITIGNNKNRKNLLSDDKTLAENNIKLIESNRGGDITFHGPGQLVCYPIFDLTRFGKDLSTFVFNLEQVIIDTLEEYGIEGNRIDKIRGVFVGNNKIASVGLHVKKWITMHGFSLNINVSLDYFSNIVACGLKEHEQTSLKKITGNEVPVSDVKELVLKKFRNIFNIELLDIRTL